jgi:hypothetical protein
VRTFRGVNGTHSVPYEAPSLNSTAWALPRPCCLLDSRLNSGATEADVAATVVGAVVDTGRRTAAPRVAEPRPATQHFGPASFGRLPNLAIIRCALIVGMPRVFHPFPDIAEHIIQPPRVGLLALNLASPRPLVVELLLLAFPPTFSGILGFGQVVIYAAVTAIPGNRGECAGASMSPHISMSPV